MFRKLTRVIDEINYQNFLIANEDPKTLDYIQEKPMVEYYGIRATWVRAQKEKEKQAERARDKQVTSRASK